MLLRWCFLCGPVNYQKKLFMSWKYLPFCTSNIRVDNVLFIGCLLVILNEGGHKRQQMMKESGNKETERVDSNNTWKIRFINADQKWPLNLNNGETRKITEQSNYSRYWQQNEFCDIKRLSQLSCSCIHGRLGNLESKQMWPYLWWSSQQVWLAMRLILQLLRLNDSFLLEFYLIFPVSQCIS